MKKVKCISLLALTGLAVLGTALTSCSSNSNIEIYGYDENNEIKKYGESEIVFKKDSKIPYISLESGVAFMSKVRSTNLDDEKYKFELKKEGNNYVISNETGAKCIIDNDKKTFTYNDYDQFVSVVPDFEKPLSLLPLKKNFKALKIVSSDYKAGSERVISFKDYPLLDIYEKGDECYLPLSVYNSILLNTNDNVNLAYNGKYLFVVCGNQLSDSTLGFPLQTPLGEKFHEGAEKGSITEEEMNYYYQSLCFDFNNEYGLNGKFDNFDNYLTTHNFKNNLLSTDPKKIDENTAIALSYLGDGHTALSEFSNLYEYGTNNIDVSKFNPDRVAYEKADEALVKAKKENGVNDGIEYKNDTAFVSFAQFTNVDEDLLYKEPSDKDLNLDDFTGIDDIPGLDFGINDLLNANTSKLFSDLYKELTLGEHKNTVKNIVVDLTTNDGGAADGLIYSLSTLIGNVTVDIVDYKTGAYNHQVYKADINSDGEIDEKDKPLSEWGFNIYFLNSSYSFSSANAMPVLAKENNSKVITLGAKTAGGPCAVRNYVTPIGSVISSSSLYTISKKVNGQYFNIDDGINADFVLDEDKMIDREFIANNINNYKK